MMNLSQKSNMSLNEDLVIGFLGCGNMGIAIAQAWITNQVIQPRQLLICARTTAIQSAKRLGGQAVSQAELLEIADIIVLGFKPQHLSMVAQQLQMQGLIWKNALVLSLLAGVRCENLVRAFDQSDLRPTQIVRLMPNLPARYGLGATLAYTESEFTEIEQGWVNTLLDALGITEWLSSEELFDVGTAISGCGPAYLFMVIEALADAGVSLGLPRKTAQRLAAQTMLGSGTMALHEHPAVLKDQVTSPGGVTIQGVRSLEQAGLRSAMIEAVIKAVERAREL